MLVSSLAALILVRTGPVPFVRAVRGASRIVMGRVERTFTFEGHRFAEITVARALKGSSGAKGRILAEPTWTCDVTEAKVGETGLFLLWNLEPRGRWRDHDGTRSTAIRQVRRNGPVYCLGTAGEGRIVFGRSLTLGKLGNSWYYGPFIMPHAIPPLRDRTGKPYYAPDRLAYAVRYCLEHA